MKNITKYNTHISNKKTGALGEIEINLMQVLIQTAQY